MSDNICQMPSGHDLKREVGRGRFIAVCYEVCKAMNVRVLQFALGGTVGEGVSRNY